MRLSLLLVLITSTLFGMVLPENAPFPGGVIVQEIESTTPPKVYHGKRQLMVLPANKKDHYIVIAGIGLNQKVDAPYKMSIKEGKQEQFHSIYIEDKVYKKQYITIKEELTEINNFTT